MSTPSGQNNERTSEPGVILQRSATISEEKARATAVTGEGLNGGSGHRPVIGSTRSADDAHGAIQDALLQARQLLKEQLARHSAEQDRLFDRLLASTRQGTSPVPGHSSVRSTEVGEVDGLASDAVLGARVHGREVQVRRSTSTWRKVDHGSSMQHSGAQSERSMFGGPQGMCNRSSDLLPDKAFYVADPNLLPKTRSMLERIEHKISKATSRREDEGGFAHRSLFHCSSILRQLRMSHEPERTGCLAKLISSRSFGALCMVCIAMNALFLVYVADSHMSHMAHTDADTSEFIMAVETSFLIFYAIELLMKLFVHRLYFFWCEDANWNVLDFALICSSSVEIAFASSAVNYSFMRSFRLFKLAKVLRVFRAIRFCTELRMVFDCILGSICNSVWCLAMILFLVYMFALLLVQSIAAEVHDHRDHWSQEQVLEVHSFFGSVGLAMLTLLQSTTGGHDWGKIYSLLASARDQTLALMFLAYVVFFALAAWNIVTALFVEKALKLAQPDIDTLVMQNNIRDATDAEELTRMFTLLDADRSGTISLSELRHLIEHPKFRACLRARGIEVTYADLFHRMMLSVADDSNQEVDIQFLVAACLRMKGSASSMDLHALSFESKLTGRSLRRYNREHLERLDRIERALAELSPAKDFGCVPPDDNEELSL